MHKSHCSASSNLAIHKVFLRFSSLIRAISAAHLLMSLLFAVSWVFPSTIIYCSCYPKIFYHFTFTCALFSFQGTCEPFGSLGNFEIIFVFLVRRAMLLHAQERKAEMSQNLVGSSGLEPPTSRLSGVRSNQLSYEPKSLTLVEVNGFEPMTPCLQSRCSPS